jgi:hypothetical protein
LSGFLGVNLGQEIMNSSTLCASRLPPKIQKSNNTPLNLNKDCRKNSIDVTRKNIEKKNKRVK